MTIEVYVKEAADFLGVVPAELVAHEIEAIQMAYRLGLTVDEMARSAMGDPEGNTFWPVEP